MKKNLVQNFYKKLIYNLKNSKNLFYKNNKQLNKHIIKEINKQLSQIERETNKKLPICLLIKTEMGNGVDFMMNTHEWHGVAPNDEQLEIALSQNPETLGDY